MEEQTLMACMAAFDVETEDGYILTTFHVTGSKKTGKFNPDKGTVLI